MLKFVKEYLLGRKQRVTINGVLSDECPVISGYPNGRSWVHYCLSSLLMTCKIRSRKTLKLLSTQMTQKSGDI